MRVNVMIGMSGMDMAKQHYRTMTPMKACMRMVNEVDKVLIGMFNCAIVCLWVRHNSGYQKALGKTHFTHL